LHDLELDLAATPPGGGRRRPDRARAGARLAGSARVGPVVGLLRQAVDVHWRPFGVLGESVRARGPRGRVQDALQKLGATPITPRLERPGPSCVWFEIDRDNWPVDFRDSRLS